MTTQKQTSEDSLMTELTVVQFETSTFDDQTYVSELSDGPPYTVHGVALGAGDVTVGQSGIKKKWPAEELKNAADSLRGTNLVVDHNNGADGVVGNVTKAGYKDGTGVVYEAELFDENLAEKVKSGLLEVSIRGYHADVDSLEEDEETEALIVEDITFDNLSIVPTGAAPSNTLEIGEHAELSAAELSAFTDDLEAAELEGIEPGMWVKWGDKRGITISQIEDGEIEVDVYEEMDGKWRSTEETTMVPTDDLSEWDVDEDKIGEAKESDSEDSDDESEESEEENASVERGQFVKWKDVDNNWRHGQIIEMEQEGQQMVATLRLFTEDGDKLSETEKKPIQGLDMWDGAPQGDDSPEEETPSNDEMPSDDEGVQDVGLNDVLRVLNAFVEENASTTKDVPTEDAEPEHEPMGAEGVESLLEQFIEEEGEDATIGEFRQWLDMDDLSINRGEGEEEVLDSEAKRENARENQPERFIYEDDDDDELAKHHHKVALDAIAKFLDRDEADGDVPVGKLVEWAKSDDVTAAVEEFTSNDGASMDSPISDLQTWLANVVEEESDEEASADEGNTESVSDAEELQDYEMHTPEWSGTTESDWSSPDLEDFDTDDLSEVAKHFLISASGFPPEDFTDLKLPVVEPNGDLNLNALAAVKGGRGVSAVDGLSDDMESKIVDWVNSTANEEFDEDWGNEEEENAQAEAHEIDGTSGRPTPQTQQRLGGVRVLSGDDLRQLADKSEESDVDSLTIYKVDNMTENIEEKLSELDEPVAVEASEVEELREKADRFEEMSESLEALRERTDILDEVDRSQVEELADAEDPVVKESARYEELQSEAEQVKTVYAASLAEEMPAFTAEELADNFSIESLREKFEEHIGDVEEELASSESAEPRSQDPTEEELEDAANEESEADEAEEELADQVADKQAEIRDKILGGN